MKRGETLVECAAREAFEEVGALLQGEPRLLGIYFYQVYGRSDHIAVFVSEQFDFTTPTDLWEIEGRAWYALNALPPDIASSCRQRVREYQAGGGPYLGKW
jgi:8-oxo-dGTP pyrophosphatase MutT (NUDIX family)